jgi:hypothetical protein
MEIPFLNRDLHRNKYCSDRDRSIAFPASPTVKRDALVVLSKVRAIVLVKWKRGIFATSALACEYD